MTDTITEEEYANPNLWLVKNDPIPFLLNVASKMHIGDEPLLLAHILAAHSLGLGPEVDPIHVYCAGQSGKGKGHTANTILKLFPENRKVALGSFSDKAFYYASEKRNMDAVIIHFPEVTINPKDEEKMAFLRMLLDSPSQNMQPEHWTVDTNDKNKKEHRNLKLRGRKSVWFSSVSTIGDDQIKNRLLLGNPDESKKQDEMVFHHHVKRLWQLQIQSPTKEIGFCMRLNDEILKENDMDVFIPFGDFLEFPDVNNRRLFPEFTTLVKVITKVRYCIRNEITLVGNGQTRKAFLATPEDVELAILVWDYLHATTKSQCSRAAIEILDFLPVGENSAITKYGLADLSGKSTDWCYKKCRELFNAGLAHSEKRERKWYYWKDASQSFGLTSGVRVQWQNVGEKELARAFECISVIVEDKPIIEEYCKQYANYSYTCPSWIKRQETPVEPLETGSSSESDDNPSSTKGLESRPDAFKPIVESEFVEQV